MDFSHKTNAESTDLSRSGIMEQLSMAVAETGDGNSLRTTQTRQTKETTDNDHSFSLLSRTGLPLP
jgi:hypothetical protein